MEIDMETAMDKKPAAPKKIRSKRADTPIADLIKYTPDLEKYIIANITNMGHFCRPILQYF